MKYTRAIAPSILAADFGDFKNAVFIIDDAGGDLVHIDIMDGNFVPNLTFGPKLVHDLRKTTKLPLDVHLMVNHPENYIHDLAQGGADIITFHLEAGIHSDRTIQKIREAGIQVGISIVPSTPVTALVELIDKVDLVLIMTVNPGFGGQKLIHTCLQKMTDLKKMRNQGGLDFVISADGGVTKENHNLFWKAGADIIIAGSSFFSSTDKKEFIHSVKNS